MSGETRLLNRHLLGLFVLSSSICLSEIRSTAQTIHPTELAKISRVSFKQTAEGVDVQIGGELFTRLSTKRFSKPILYPVYSPGQIGMTRKWPMEHTQHEPHDHSHHKSLWVGHFINGIDFWTEAGGKVIVGDLQIDAEQGKLITKSDWISNDGRKICSDETHYAFGVSDLFRSSPYRWVDVSVTFSSGDQDVRFEDTKEGTFAIRTHPNLQLTPATEAGPQSVSGTARNSEGVQGKGIWGQKAKWVLYQGAIDGTDVAIAVFDHPENLRHPTTWHARDYGLVAANPFGLHEFQGKPAGDGQFTLAKGEKLTLRYRACFIKGKPNDRNVERWYSDFAVED